jgi:hypothetical protein
VSDKANPCINTDDGDLTVFADNITMMKTLKTTAVYDNTGPITLFKYPGFVVIKI